MERPFTRKNLSPELSSVCGNWDERVIYLVSEHAKCINIARFGGLCSGQSERLRVHQFRSAAARQLKRVLRPSDWGGLNEGGTQTCYAGSTIGVDHHVRLEERGCERVTAKKGGV